MEESTLAGRLLFLVEKHARGKAAAFARAAGINRSTFQNYIKGTRSPDAEILKKIHSFTGCDLNWLLTGEAIPFGSDQGAGHVAEGDKSAGALDEAILQEVIAGLEEGIKEAGLELTPEKKAQLTGTFYRHATKSKQKLDKNLMDDMIKLAGD